MTDLTDLGIRDIRDGVRAGTFSARDVATAFNDAVSRAKPLNAFLVETPDHALAAADAADATECVDREGLADDDARDHATVCTGGDKSREFSPALDNHQDEHEGDHE